MAGTYYVWRMDGKPVEVFLDLALVERMQALILHDQLRRTEDDAYGMLLGRSVRHKDRIITIVQDFEPMHAARLRSRPVPPEGSGLKIVGLYRSSPGSELRLDSVDAGFIGAAFQDPAMVYLLIRPEHGQPAPAALFVQEDGAIHGYVSPHPFPFHSELLRQQGPIEASVPRPRRKKGWIAATAAGLVLMAAGGWYASAVASENRNQPETVAVEAPVASPSVLPDPSSADRHAEPKLPAKPASSVSARPERKVANARSNTRRSAAHTRAGRNKRGVPWWR